MTVTLRFYQEDAVNAVRQKMRTHSAILLVLATGAGKTVIFSYIARAAAEKGKRVLILAHRDTLIKQASRKLREYGVHHGIIMGGMTPDRSALVQVGSVQTLARRLEKITKEREQVFEKAKLKAIQQGIPEEKALLMAEAAAARLDYDLIVIDEAHLSGAKSYIDIVNQWPRARVLGVTGSPIRLDGKGLSRQSGGLFDTMVTGITLKKLIELKFLVQPVVFGPEEYVDLSGVGMAGKDFDEEELAKVMDKPKITGSAVEQYKKICSGVPAVVWCVNVKHAMHVADQFNASGIKAVMLHGESSSAERDAALSGLADGSIKVITFCMLLIEGVDCPAIGAVIILRPTLSLSSYLQAVGRGLRPFDLKEVCFVLDHAGLWKTHGLPDEDRDWMEVFHGKKKKKKKGKNTPEDNFKFRQCPKCFGVHDIAPACPHCGHVYPVASGAVDAAEGDLKQITPEMAARAKKEKAREVAGARTLKELEEIAKQRGYSPYWAKHVFQARQRKAAA